MKNNAIFNTLKIKLACEMSRPETYLVQCGHYGANTIPNTGILTHKWVATGVHQGQVLTTNIFIA